MIKTWIIKLVNWILCFRDDQFWHFTDSKFFTSCYKKKKFSGGITVDDKKTGPKNGPSTFMVNDRPVWVLWPFFLGYEERTENLKSPEHDFLIGTNCFKIKTPNTILKTYFNVQPRACSLFQPWQRLVTPYISYLKRHIRRLLSKKVICGTFDSTTGGTQL